MLLWVANGTSNVSVTTSTSSGFILSPRVSNSPSTNWGQWPPCDKAATQMKGDRFEASKSKIDLLRDPRCKSRRFAPPPLAKVQFTAVPETLKEAGERGPKFSPQQAHQQQPVTPAPGDPNSLTSAHIYSKTYTPPPHHPTTHAHANY